MNVTDSAFMQNGVLVVDDDEAIVRLVCSVLEREGIRSHGCTNGEDALRALEREPFSLVILDIMMPGMDGFEVCRRIRETSSVQICFLSAKDEEADKVVGLTLGGDDYIAKPFKPRELVARVKARLRRASGELSARDVMSAGGVEVDIRRHEACLHGVALELTPKEFDILALLVRNAGRPVPAKELFERTWGEAYQAGDSNTVMVHIRRLRRKLEAVDSSQRCIETVYGVGYRIVDGAI